MACINAVVQDRSIPEVDEFKAMIDSVNTAHSQRKKATLLTQMKDFFMACSGTSLTSFIL